MASLRDDLEKFGLDARDPAVVMALVFMLKRFAQLLMTWGPRVQMIDPHIACCAASLELSLGSLVLDFVPAEARPPA